MKEFSKAALYPAAERNKNHAFCSSASAPGRICFRVRACFSSADNGSKYP